MADGNTATRPNGPRIVLLVALAAFLADWATKSWALTLGNDAMAAGILALEVARNDAFAFSAGSGIVDATTVVSVRLLGLLLVLLLLSRSGALPLRSALGVALLVAGGLGNALDVILRDGAVVDFISAGPWALSLADQPILLGFVFNVADIWVFAGVFLLWPQFRSMGVRAQQRMAALEQRVLARVEA
ncbi:MAG TPA: signal peptidase II [Longimicrobiales bacterium]|nr:signal peptidase II [Longimicrobiales bacterium]